LSSQFAFSGHYWMSMWRFLLERDWTVQVFNPVLSGKSAHTHLRGRIHEEHDYSRLLRWRLSPPRSAQSILTAQLRRRQAADLIIRSEMNSSKEGKCTAKAFWTATR
jgi:hypothetical protein